MNRLILFYLNHDKLFAFLFLSAISVIGCCFAFTATAHAYIQPINPNVGAVPQTGASGILNTAITWVCYRLAPVTTLGGVVKGLYDIKTHQPQAARKAFITGAAGAAAMIAPSLVNAVISIVNQVHQ